MRNRDQKNSHKEGKTMGNTLKNQTTRTRLKQYMRTFLFEAFGYLCSSVILGLWFLFIAWFLLSGCSTTSETFDCKEGKGVGCKSISEVNRMVDQGMLRDGTLEVGGSVSMMPSPPPIILAGYPNEKNTINNKIANVTLALLVSTAYVTGAMESDDQQAEGKYRSNWMRGYEYTAEDLEDLKEAAKVKAQIHAEVGRALLNFENNMNTYYERTGNPKIISMTLPWKDVQEKQHEQSTDEGRDRAIAYK